MTSQVPRRQFAAAYRHARFFCVETWSGYRGSAFDPQGALHLLAADCDNAALGQALKQNGLGSAAHDLDDFTPHVTLLRDAKAAKAQKIDPMTWQVADFVLVQSLLGKTTHIHLGRWPLKAPV